MEEKKDRVKPRIILLNHIKAGESYEKIENVGETGCLEHAYKQKTNDDDDEK